MQRYPRSTAPRPRSLPNAVTAAATTEQVLARGRALASTNREHPRSRGETTDPPRERQPGPCACLQTPAGRDDRSQDRRHRFSSVPELAVTLPLRGLPGKQEPASGPPPTQDSRGFVDAEVSPAREDATSA